MTGKEWKGKNSVEREGKSEIVENCSRGTDKEGTRKRKSK
jgi:hypothetical protein